MQNNNSKLNTILLLIAVFLLVVLVWMLGTNTHRYTPREVSQDEVKDGYGDDILEPKEEDPKPVQDTRKITFLKSFIGRNGTMITPEIRECQNAGTGVIAVTYDGEYMADGGWTIYDANIHEVVETCGGFTAEPMPENSFCRTGLASCNVVYKNATGVDIDVYNLD